MYNVFRKMNVGTCLHYIETFSFSRKKASIPTGVIFKEDGYFSVTVLDCTVFNLGFIGYFKASMALAG